MILEEANRLYDSLLHHFTDSIMDNAGGAASSYNPALSLPQSSSTLPSLSHNDTYRIEHPEIYHNDKIDIASIDIMKI
jgi:hypothetical protein